ncbi:MAG TPA: class I SAM-dependent methyltransferase [Rudaea sp.]|jgi:SAM-dependent methyltransferase|nr:class I SAM-dependent methyltransferase [Rudaea sp.]
MTEIRKGLRHILARPGFYDAFQRGIGAYAWHARVLRHYAAHHLHAAGSILDIGCGTGDVVAYLPPDATYHGFDRNAAYIEKARRRFPSNNVTFHCEQFDGELRYGERKFDLVLAIGLLHHLDDAEVIALMAGVRHVLAADGLLLTLDPVRTRQQSKIARFLVAHDRGKNVRTPEEYLRLARMAFPSADGVIDNNPMRVPYTGYILQCRL